MKNSRVYRPTNRTATGKREWYKIKNLGGSAPAEVWLYDEIGEWGITAADFVADLQAVGGNEIDLHINSGGGEVWDGIAIYNAIKNHPATVTTYVDGLAASAASFIAMAGDNVVMTKNSELMIHDAMGLVIGNSADMAKMIEMLDRTSDNIASIYAEKTGGTVEEWRAVMKEEKWYNAEEAVASGLADSIQGQEESKDEQPTDVVDAIDPDLIRNALKEAFA